MLANKEVYGEISLVPSSAARDLWGGVQAGVITQTQQQVGKDGCKGEP